MKLALSISGRHATEETFDACKDAGILSVEVSNGKKDDADLIDFPALKRMADARGIELWSFHLPFYNTPEKHEKVDISYPAVADAVVSYHCSLIDKAAAVGIRTIVIHPSAEPIPDEMRAERIARSKKSLYTLAEYAKAKGVVIAVEDLPRTCLGRNSAELLEIISVHPDLRICFDTNHLLSEDVVAFIENAGKKIVTTHISDYDFVNERHWLPGEGMLDWGALKAAFESASYTGPWLYELGLGGSNWTIDRERALTHADIRKNYDEIMSGMKPTPFGKAKPNLPMTRPKN